MMTDEGQRPPWRRRLSLRLRITLVTAVVVAVVVALGGILILIATSPNRRRGRSTSPGCPGSHSWGPVPIGWQRRGSTHRRAR